MKVAAMLRAKVLQSTSLMPSIARVAPLCLVFVFACAGTPPTTATADSAQNPSGTPSSGPPASSSSIAHPAGPWESSGHPQLASLSWPMLSDTLPGVWTAQTADGHALTVSYRVTSRGSTVVESWAPGSRAETMTAYHPDNGRVLLTHYCGQGNQATLVADDADAKRVHFRRIAVTNATADHSVLTELTLEFSRTDKDAPTNGVDEATFKDTLVRTEVYVNADGRAETTVLRFRRTPPSP